MNLISSLISGIRGAENGTADLYRRGTSTYATWYATFEADGAISSGASITLDANGGAEVYVDELVDVVVKDSAGTTIRSFTEGDSSPPVEVRSPSFTGTRYDTAAAAPGNPTTLQAVLDLWVTKNGEEDWEVRFNGGSSTIRAALSQLNGKLFYNVKDDAFGAVGDGGTDDTIAIQAAITAAQAAGGGTVVFPDGAYKITSELAVGPLVHLWGMAPQGPSSGSLIMMNHATAHFMRFTGRPLYQMYQEIRNLTLVAQVANSGACVIVATGEEVDVHFHNCNFGNNLHTGDLIRGHGLSFTDCFFQIEPTTNMRAVNQVDNSSNDWMTLYFESCVFYIASAGAYTPADGMINARNIVLRDCTFNLDNMSGGDAFLLDCESSAYVVAIGNRSTTPGGGTVRMFYLGNVEPTDRIFEDFNIVDGSEISADFGLYSIVTVAGAPASAWQGFWLGSRERNSINIQSDDATLDISAMQYALIINSRQANQAQALSADAVIPNGSLTLITKNDGIGGTTGNVTLDTADFYPGDVFAVATNNLADIRRWRGADVDGQIAWFADSMPRNNV